MVKIVFMVTIKIVVKIVFMVRKLPQPSGIYLKLLQKAGSDGSASFSDAHFPAATAW